MTIKNHKNNFVLIVLFCLFLSPLASGDQCFAFSTGTHKAINEHVSQCANFDAYLKIRLGMIEGTESSINDRKIFEIIGDGGEYEDKKPRMANHFHNPLTNKGLEYRFLGIPITSHRSARDWAVLPSGEQSLSLTGANDSTTALA